MFGKARADNERAPHRQVGLRQVRRDAIKLMVATHAARFVVTLPALPFGTLQPSLQQESETRFGPETQCRLHDRIPEGKPEDPPQRQRSVAIKMLDPVSASTYGVRAHREPQLK